MQCVVIRRPVDCEEREVFALHRPLKRLQRVRLQLIPLCHGEDPAAVAALLVIVTGAKESHCGHIAEELDAGRDSLVCPDKHLPPIHVEKAAKRYRAVLINGVCGRSC
jgi:hypothetical protein